MYVSYITGEIENCEINELQRLQHEANTNITKQAFDYIPLDERLRKNNCNHSALIKILNAAAS
jgi:ribosomal 50S subunit-associated protein YjgA (DUF615 family)